MTTTTVGWTEHEDNLLWVFRALDRRTFEEVARQLGRTVDSVKNRFTCLKQTRDENNYFDRFWNAGFERDSLQLPLQKTMCYLKSDHQFHGNATNALSFHDRRMRGMLLRH